MTQIVNYSAIVKGIKVCIQIFPDFKNTGKNQDIAVHGKFLRGFFDRGLKYSNIHVKKGGSIWYFCLIISALFGI